MYAIELFVAEQVTNAIVVRAIADEGTESDEMTFDHVKIVMVGRRILVDVRWWRAVPAKQLC